MNKTTEALKLAEAYIAGMKWSEEADKALAAIREALAEPVHQSWCNTVVSISPNPVKCNCKAEPVQEPVACKHEWFRTGAMQIGECRCIHCGEWKSSAPIQPVGQK